MILGTGHYVPEKVLTNAYFEKIVDTTDQWIVERTGIHERRIKAPGQNTSDLCVPAAREAIEDAGLTPTDLDLIIVGTVTGDMKFPATSIFIQSKLGAHQAAAMDISAACSGFVYGLALADSLVRSGGYKHVLVIGTETLSLMTNW
ncbi:3-oxoacyl-ACP synthase, partial [bacterium]|nr:3-oxoacyl-ACP synthase [bacterium]